jgi:hypothetical protein
MFRLRVCTQIYEKLSDDVRGTKSALQRKPRQASLQLIHFLNLQHQRSLWYGEAAILQKLIGSRSIIDTQGYPLCSIHHLVPPTSSLVSQR